LPDARIQVLRYLHFDSLLSLSASYVNNAWYLKMALGNCALDLQQEVEKYAQQVGTHGDAD
jgi:hypothetical protein